MNILWVGDAVVSSGFAKCTHAVCDTLHESGHAVTVLGLNHHGNPNHGYPYKIYPCMDPFNGGRDALGVTRLPGLLDEINPDIVVFLNDPWNIPTYLDAIKDCECKPTTVGWIAVDGLNQNGYGLNGLDHVVTWTQFAIDELHEGGYNGTTDIVPLGVDRSVFYNRGKEEARKQLPSNVPQDSYIVGYVGRLQVRKRVDLLIRYFAKWIKDCHLDDAYLLIHAAPTGEGCVDVDRLAHYYGVQDKVLRDTNIGIGFGYPEDLMANLYSMFDVYFTTTQGEGWGLCSLEAMSCGLPVIAPNWSGLGDWATGAADLVYCSSTALTAPLNTSPYTIGGIMDENEAIETLDWAYQNRGLNLAGIRLAKQLTWEMTGSKFQCILEELVS